VETGRTRGTVRFPMISAASMEVIPAQVLESVLPDSKFVIGKMTVQIMKMRQIAIETHHH